MSTETTPRPAQAPPYDAAAEQRVAAYLAEPRPLPVAHFDARGHLLPPDAETDRRRAEALAAWVEEMRNAPADDGDPPDTLERLMRGIDEDRPPGSKLFEGMY